MLLREQFSYRRTSLSMRFAPSFFEFYSFTPILTALDNISIDFKDKIVISILFFI